MQNYKKLLSIVVLTWNGQDLIKKNLDSILKNADSSWEIIVVDNGSKDKTAEIVRQYSQASKSISSASVKLIQNEKNLGFAKGNNVGIKAAAGKYILLLNQDVEQIDNAIFKMVEFLEKNQIYAAAAPQLLYPNGRMQDSCRPFYTWANLMKDYLTFGFWRKKFYDHGKSQVVDQPMASALMVRGDLLRELNGFDEQEDFWFYFNDVDLSYRIYKKGFQHYLLTEAQFYHHHGQSAAKLFPFKRLWLYHKGLHGLFLKHFVKSKISVKYFFLWLVLIFSFIITILREWIRWVINKLFS